MLLLLLHLLLVLPLVEMSLRLVTKVRAELVSSWAGSFFKGPLILSILIAPGAGLVLLFGHVARMLILFSRMIFDSLELIILLRLQLTEVDLRVPSLESRHLVFFEGSVVTIWDFSTLRVHIALPASRSSLVLIICSGSHVARCQAAMMRCALFDGCAVAIRRLFAKHALIRVDSFRIFRVLRGLTSLHERQRAASADLLGRKRDCGIMLSHSI